MVTLRAVDKDNYRAILDMELPEPRFVAPNIYSLAQAYVFGDTVQPYAIYWDEAPVGFLMLGQDDENAQVAWLQRMMIALEWQNRGLGQQAVSAAVELVRARGCFNVMKLGYNPENVRAVHVYKKVGFVETDEVDNGENVMAIWL